MPLRHAIPADIPALLALERQAETAAHWSQEHYARVFGSTEPARVMLVIEESELLGFLVARPVGREWEIENIAVAEQARRKGFGSQLLAEFLDVARARGGEAVFLEVRESNRAARALYQKRAFTESGRRTRYYRAPEEDAIVYRLSFS